MNDLAFSRRMEASQQVLVMLRLELESALSVIRFIDGQAKVVETGLDLLEKMSSWSWRLGYDAAGGDPKALVAFSDDPIVKPSELEVSIRQAGADTQAVTLRLREMWAETRNRELQSAANDLAAFDAFSRSHWGMEGAEAIKAHGDLFSDVEYLDEIAAVAVDADADAVKGLRASFDMIWQQLLHQEETAGNA